MPDAANGGAAGGDADPLAVMLEARTVAVVGASPRPGSLGSRMVSELARSPARPRSYLVNPRYDAIGGTRCYRRLADLPEAVDLVLLGVPDAALEEQLAAAADRGDRSAVIFGNAFGDTAGAAAGAPPGLRGRLAAIARSAGMPLCGAGCMGFVNNARGLRAVGYVESDPLPSGPVALVTHSGSVFSALLRARRGFGFSVAVSSGQELVTTAAAYARYALGLTETRVLALVLEALRDAAAMRSALSLAAARDVPVVLLSAGASDAGRPLVSAHSGALAAGDGTWQALARAYRVHRVGDLAEMADTLEVFAAGRRCRAGGGIATVHDSGFERAHVADVASGLGVPFAAIGPHTRERLAALLDPGLEPANPLDVWGTGRDTEDLFAGSLTALADDPAVGAVALAVDLVPEYDGDESYPRAVLTAASRTAKPVVVLAGVPSAIDPASAALLRAAGVPVLEGVRSGLLALRHLLDHATAARPGTDASDAPPPADPVRRQRWAAALTTGTLGGAALFDLLRDYGIPAVRAAGACTLPGALSAAAAIGYPVVLKTDAPGIPHKSDAGGVRLGIATPDELTAAYRDLTARLGPRVIVCETAVPGTELMLGIARDPALGPLIVTAAGGLLVEFFSERAVALPPVTPASARAILGSLRVSGLLDGARGHPPADQDAIASALVSLSVLASELGDLLEAFDINPLVCTPSGVLAVDALAIPRHPSREHQHGTGPDLTCTGSVAH